MKTTSIKTLFAASVAALALHIPGHAQNSTNSPAQASAQARTNLYDGLIDHNGKPVSSETFGGRLQVVFLGFTSCPTICPNRISDLVAAHDKMKPADAERTVITFITIDPQNDIPERLKNYIGDRPMIGLTGTPETIDRIKKVFGETGGTANHMGLTYLVNGNTIITAIPYTASTDRIAGATTGCLEMCGLPPARAPQKAPAGPAAAQP